MAHHITRRELKKDEIRETFTHGAEAIFSHQRVAWIVGGVALLVLVAGLGWRFYTQRQTTSAAAELSDAMKIYQARIRAANEPAAPEEVTYVDEKNKFSDAAAKFTGVADRYGRTQPGRLARYYAALSLVRVERNDDAEKLLKAAESDRDEGLAALARFQLAQLYDKTGKGQQSVPLYQQLIDKPTAFVPKAIALLALADHYGTTDAAQAAKLYKQVKSEFPESQAAQTADQRLQLLPVKG